MPIPSPANLPQRVARMYFRVFTPMLAVGLAWGAWGADSGTVLLMLCISASLLLFTALHLLLPEKYQNRLNFSLGAWLISLLAFLAFFSNEMGVNNDQAQLSALLLFVPLSTASFGLLYFKQPRLARLMSVLLTLAFTLVLARWNSPNLPLHTSTVIMAFLSGLIAAYFGETVSNLQRQANHAQENSRRDALTGLLNRRAFNEYLTTSPPGTLAVLDIDLFKAVNDTYGHDAGDRVLRAVADVLLDQLGHQGEAYRWGGEEFVVFIPASSSLEPLQMLEAVRHEVARRSFVGGTHVTLSAGLSRVESGQTLANAFEAADRALMHAKQTGRNRVVDVQELNIAV